MLLMLYNNTERHITDSTFHKSIITQIVFLIFEMKALFEDKSLSFTDGKKQNILIFYGCSDIREILMVTF